MKSWGEEQVKYRPRGRGSGGDGGGGGGVGGSTGVAGRREGENTGPAKSRTFGGTSACGV